MGPPTLRMLAMPLELQRGPWVLAAGEYRNSRRTGLPPGSYRVELRASPAEPGRSACASSSTRASCRWARRSSPTPSRARSSRSCCPPARASSGHRDRGGGTSPPGRGPRRAGSARPAARRGDFPYPVRPIPDRYRVGGPLVRATALDRSEPEDGGFRLDGAEGSLPRRRADGGVGARGDTPSARTIRGRASLGRSGRAAGRGCDVGARASDLRGREPRARERRAGAGTRAGRVGPVQRGGDALGATAVP